MGFGTASAQATGARPCGQPSASLKPDYIVTSEAHAMLAIGMIVTFIAVMLGLNFLEFGRGD